MKIYILKNENSENLLPFLSEQRLEKVNGISNAKVREEKICSYALLRYALFKEYGVTDVPVFSYGEREKPYLKNYPHIFFSLSHAGGYSACAVSREEIGIDIQDIRPMKFDISAKICTETELLQISGEDPMPSEAICRLWCMKESVGKLTGKGFGEGFDRIETSGLMEKGLLEITELDNGMLLSACGYTAITGIEPVNVTEEDVCSVLS